MARSMLNSILFLDSHKNHISLNLTNGMVFPESIDDLFQSFRSSTEVEFSVCICYPNKSDILDRLEACANVASISICKEHHRNTAGENDLTSHSKVKRELVLDESFLWQIAAHEEAFHANANIGQSNAVESIRSNIQNLIEQQMCKPNISSEAN